MSGKSQVPMLELIIMANLKELQPEVENLQAPL